MALVGTELARAYVGTIRIKLLKIGAVILRNTRRIRFLLSSGEELFNNVGARFRVALLGLSFSDIVKQHRPEQKPFILNFFVDLSA